MLKDKAWTSILAEGQLIEFGDFFQWDKQNQELSSEYSS